MTNQAAHIAGNYISIGSGIGIVLNPKANDNSVISDNTIIGSSGSIGIYLTSPSSPNSGGHSISGNIISGFTTPISIDMTKHPGTVITPK